MNLRPASAAEERTDLSDANLQVVLTLRTGQVVSVSDAQGTKFVEGTEDRYDLDGKLTTEAADTVASKTVGADGAAFECVNETIGIKLRKQYRLKGNVLEKQVTYLGLGPDKLLLKVSSRTMIERSLYTDGYYYLPTDDGYKVRAVPFTPGPSVKEPIAWTVSTGSFAYYFPRVDRLLAHYRYKVNGHYFYGEADRPIESKFIPGGAITAIGQGFISAKDSLTLESRYVLIAGDPWDYHRHLLSQPPFTDFKDRRIPEWFRKARWFLSDAAAAGRDLVNKREAAGKDLLSFLELVRPDDDVLIIFNHWTTMGDFPYKGTFRYYTYTSKGYSDPVPVEKLKENIRWLKSLSPRIKVGGYALFVPMQGTYPYDQHGDWMAYERNGVITFAGDGLAPGGAPDFTSGYREYLLDQMKHYIADLGFDWIHIDFGPVETVNWKTRHVVQVYEPVDFHDELAKIFEAHDAAVVQNVGWAASLWAHGSYVECQQPDRWEKKDWRILAVPGSLSVLYRTNRPGAICNLCYGTRGIYGIRNAQSGFRGWIRNACNFWRDISHSLAHEKVIDELLEAKASNARVYPSWWKLQTDKLEAEAMEHGRGMIIPVLLHGEKASDQEISLKTADMNYDKGNYLFAFDLRLSTPTPVDVFRPVPWKQDYIELLGFHVEKALGDRYAHRMKLEPLRNYYHLLTQVPAWVYAYDGERASLLLPENRGVKISGSLPVGPADYALAVENANKSAQVLAYVPDDWRGADVTINGRPARPALVEVLGRKCLLMDIAGGTSEIRVSDSKTSDMSKLSKAAYTNPFSYVWRESAQRFGYINLQHRAYEEEGKSCLALKTAGPGAGGADLHMTAKEEAGGFSIKVKGENSGSRLIVTQFADAAWTYEIKDNFTGWKEFNIYSEQMTPPRPPKQWGPTSIVYLRLYPPAGKETHIADFKLLPARKGGFPERQEIVKRRLTIYRTAKLPVIDGYGNDPCWKNCEEATGFLKYGTNTPAESKTLVRACYDDENLCLLFNNIEPITSLTTARVPKTQVFVSDHAHLLIDPFRDMVHYFEIAVDTAGTIADMKYSETGYDLKWSGEYEVKIGLNWNVGWMAELRVPFKTLGKRPKAGDVWGVTFARKDIVGEFSVWVPGPWSDPTLFGEMVFAGEAK